MPSASTIKQLVQDLRERKSQIARKFDKCSKDTSCRQKILNAVKNWKPLADPPEPLPDIVIQELDLTPAEVAHIEAWPQRDLVRQEVVTAIEQSLQMEFFWDLLDDPLATKSDTEIQGVGTPADPKKVAFLTRRDQVTKPGPTYGDIKLGI